MIRFLTAGESHGKALTVIIEGFPSNILVEQDKINYELKRRQMGYGRGMRMKIESDEAEILSGIRFGKTLGSPISLLIRNKDWENWVTKMSHSAPESDVEKITIPRPGHADLVGVTKYYFDDIRNSIERSSARETAARVGAGSIAKLFLEKFGIRVQSFVESIGGVYPSVSLYDRLCENLNLSAEEINVISGRADESCVRVLDKNQEEQIIEKIKEAKKNGDTLGGNFCVMATGVPPGLGSYMHYDKKLDARIAFSIMSIPAVKSVEIGNGFLNADLPGSSAHDEIINDNGVFSRKTNRAGGLEGGITTGQNILVRASMKPIATLMSPLNSIDLLSGEKVQSRRERSDFVAVPACAVIAESMLAWTLSEAMIEKFGGDSIEETFENYKNYCDNLELKIIQNFNKNDY